MALYLEYLIMGWCFSSDKYIIQEWFANNGQYPTCASHHTLFSYYEIVAFMGLVDTHCVVCVLINQHSTIFVSIRLLFDHYVLTTCRLCAHQLFISLSSLAHYFCCCLLSQCWNQDLCSGTKGSDDYNPITSFAFLHDEATCFTECPIGWLVEVGIDWLASNGNWLVAVEINWLMGWLIEVGIDWLDIGWLVDWLESNWFQVHLLDLNGTDSDCIGLGLICTESIWPAICLTWNLYALIILPTELLFLPFVLRLLAHGIQHKALWSTCWVLSLPRV